MVFRLGLTGSIGMGKSTTAAMFADLGVPVWDADAEVARLYDQGGDAVGLVGKIAPDAILEGRVDRDALKAAISKDPKLLAHIEAVVHPLVRASRENFTQAHDSADLILFDIPLLFETGAEADLDAVLVVTASAEVQRARVLARGTMDDETFQMILAKQMPDAEKRARADYVIETLSLEQTRADVVKLVAKIRGRDA
jgi:dephospho-CoA kinase